MEEQKEVVNFNLPFKIEKANLDEIMKGEGNAVEFRIKIPKVKIKFIQDERKKTGQILEFLKKKRVKQPVPIILKSEKAAVERFEFPKEGGALTYLKGFKEPFVGFPAGDSVSLLTTFKRMIPLTLKSLFAKPKFFKVGLVVSYLFGVLPALAEIQINFVYPIFQRFILDCKSYSLSTREVYRAFGAIIKENKDLLTKVRDLTCFGWEYDNAYRYRYQDILSELNKENLKKDFFGEIKRLFELTMERESDDSLQAKFTNIYKLGSRFLRFSPKWRKLVQTLLLEIDLDKIRLSKEDRYWCTFRPDYNFWGKSYKERMRDRILEYGRDPQYRLMKWRMKEKKRLTKEKKLRLKLSPPCGG